jgi:hypothetical protein
LGGAAGDEDDDDFDPDSLRFFDFSFESETRYAFLIGFPLASLDGVPGADEAEKAPPITLVMLKWISPQGDDFFLGFDNAYQPAAVESDLSQSFNFSVTAPTHARHSYLSQRS